MTYKVRGFIQTTGKQSMSALGTSAIPPLTITSLQNLNAQTNQAVWALGNSKMYNNSSGGITVGPSGLNLNHSISMADVFTTSEAHYKKYEVYEFQEDVLALSCAWKRHRDTNPGAFTYSKLTDKELFNIVNVDDRNLAKEIRDYYSKKIMMLNLKNVRLTPFRKALNSLVHNESTRTTEDLFPVIFRLPEFYEYDIKIEDLKLLLQDRPRGAQLEKAIQHGATTMLEMKPMTSLKKQNKRMKVVEYWFRTPTDIPVLIQIEPKNPLEHIWNDIFTSKKVLTISGKSFVKNMDDFEYISVTNWRLNSSQ